MMNGHSPLYTIVPPSHLVLPKSPFTQHNCVIVSQVSTTVETFQDLSLPIPGKEDLAKLHSSIHQNLPVKTNVCPDTYGSQGWISFIMDSIRRLVTCKHDHITMKPCSF